MSVADEVKTIRQSVGLSRPNHIAVLRVEGPDALDFLQTACTQSPYAREGRVRHALFLRDDASVIADVFVVKAEEAYFVLAEGDGTLSWLEGLRQRSKPNVTLRDVGEDLAVLGVDGPYAWEAMVGLLGPGILGLPYLALMRREDILCLRAGKTGEYGYLLLVPRSSADHVEQRLLEVGRPLDIAPVGLEALDVCALESWHFSMRTLRETALSRPLTPVELQLQWRVVYSREFVGAEALRARRAGPRARITCFTATREVAAGQRVRLSDVEVGEVLASCSSPTLGMTVGSVLLEQRFAHPHLTLHAGSTEIRTVTASLVDNVSLHVNPHKHSYATRGAEVAAP